jgi:hypothetical protein
MAYLPSSRFQDAFSPGQTPQVHGKSDGMPLSPESQYQQPYTIRTEGFFVDREPTYVSFTPQQTKSVRHEIPAAYVRSSFAENPPQYGQYFSRDEILSTSRVFPHYVPGQMPSDFLSVPLIPYLEGPHGPSICNLRPQFGALPVPKAPLRFQPFPFQPSWTDALVAELKRDPTWDIRLSFASFVSRLPSETHIETSIKSKATNSRVNGRSSPPPNQQAQSSAIGSADDIRARGEDAEHKRTTAVEDTAGPAAELKPALASNSEPTETSANSPALRVSSLKQVGSQLAGDESDIKANVKTTVASELHAVIPPDANTEIPVANSANLRPVGNSANLKPAGNNLKPAGNSASVSAGPPPPTAATTSGKASGTASNGGAGVGSKAAGPGAKAVNGKKDSASGGLAARRAEYERAAKSS